MSDLSTLRARVEAAQKLAAKATPGPWHAAGDCQTGGLDYVHVEVPIQPEQSVSEAILATIQMYGAHKAEAAGNANLMAAAPDLVTLATDLLAEVDRARLSASCAGFDLTAIGAACDIRDNEYPLQAVQRVVNQLNAIRAALGNGADEAAWPPGLTVAEAVGRLRSEREAVEAWLYGCAAEMKKAEMETHCPKAQARFRAGADALVCAAVGLAAEEHRQSGESMPSFCGAVVAEHRTSAGTSRTPRLWVRATR